MDIVTGDFLVNFGCQHSPHILVNTILHGQGMGWGNVIRMGVIVIIVSWEKHFIRVGENLLHYPCILYPLLQDSYY